MGKSSGSKISTKVEIEDDIHDEISNQFGWGKISDSVSIEVAYVEKVRSINTGNKYTHSTPAIKISLKNVGKNPIESFGVNYLFTNTTDKAEIGTYGIASGKIEPGWKTETYTLEVSGDDFYNAVKEDKDFNFNIHAQVYVEQKNGKIIVLYETTFYPQEMLKLESI